VRGLAKRRRRRRRRRRKVYSRLTEELNQPLRQESSRISTLTSARQSDESAANATSVSYVHTCIDQHPLGPWYL
jgi:hypothetical protein